MGEAWLVPLWRGRRRLVSVGYDENVSLRFPPSPRLRRTSWCRRQT